MRFIISYPRQWLFLSVMLVAGMAVAQDRDKVSADTLLYEQLCASHVAENYHAPLTVSKRDLESTAERGIYIVKGKSFQVKSMTSSFYVREKRGSYEPIFDKRYPMESFTNILLNRVKQNKLRITITQSMYGSSKKVPVQNMQNIYDLYPSVCGFRAYRGFVRRRRPGDGDALWQYSAAQYSHAIWKI